MSFINIFKSVIQALSKSDQQNYEELDNHRDNLTSKTMPQQQIPTNTFHIDVLPEIGSMATSVNGIIELAMYEGLSNTIYLDSGGVRTIGIGMTVSEIPDIHSWSWTRSLTNQQCVNMFKQALRKYEKAINQVLKVPVTQNEFDALVSITYNIGELGMAGSTFMKRINNYDDPERIVEAFKMWETDNGRHIKGLENRRNAESLIYLTGQYKNKGKIPYIKVSPKTHREIPAGEIDIRQYL